MTTKPEDKKPLAEDTTGHSAPNAGPPTDEDLSANQMYQQAELPSLARQILSVIPMHGPTAALFNLRRKAGTDDLEVVRSEVEVFPSAAIHTGMTQETVQDIRAQFGRSANEVVGKLLRGIANEQENARMMTFLDTESLAGPALNLSDSFNAETNLFEITQRVHELVLQINSKNTRSYEAFAVIPYKGLAGLMGLSKYAGADDKNNRGLFITEIGQTRFYFNPVPTSVTAYVGIKDHNNPSKSSGVFSPYVSDVINTINADTGEFGYHIYNRFAITESPLHVAGNEMFHKFDVVV